MQLSSCGIPANLTMENKDGEVNVSLQTKLKFFNHAPSNFHPKPSRLRCRKRRREVGKYNETPSALDEIDGNMLLPKFDSEAFMLTDDC